MVMKGEGELRMLNQCDQDVVELVLVSPMHGRGTCVSLSLKPKAMRRCLSDCPLLLTNPFSSMPS